jgi:hypothetical protein
MRWIRSRKKASHSYPLHLLHPLHHIVKRIGLHAGLSRAPKELADEVGEAAAPAAFPSDDGDRLDPNQHALLVVVRHRAHLVRPMVARPPNGPPTLLRGGVACYWLIWRLSRPSRSGFLGSQYTCLNPPLRPLTPVRVKYSSVLFAFALLPSRPTLTRASFQFLTDPFLKAMLT